MSATGNLAAKSTRHEPAKQSYTPPLLTRYGTVDELTPIIGTDTMTGSGIESDAIAAP